MTQKILNSSHTLPARILGTVSHSLTHGPPVNRTFAFHGEEKFSDKHIVNHQNHKQNKKTT